MAGETAEAKQARLDQEAADRRKIVDDAAAKTSPQAKADQAARDRDAEAARSNNVTHTDTRSEGAINEQHKQHDEFMAKRNSENEEGHAKNMERIEKEAEAVQHTEHVPTGKQNNRNTPRVLKDGTKVWDQ